MRRIIGACKSPVGGIGPRPRAVREQQPGGQHPLFREHSMQSVEIKAIENYDFDLWLPLWKGYQRFYDVDIPESVTLRTWARFLDPAEPMHAALAMVGGKALGLVHSIYHRSTWETGDYCYLQDLFVADQARGGGIGRALIEHVYADAKRRGASRVHWLTHEANHGAMQLYDCIADRSEFIQYRKLFA
jgi:GNAT superfamily N-acetyltransferase